MTKPFWQKPLAELNDEQWEALCDGCGLCCTERLIDEDDELLNTSLVCRFYDHKGSQCSVYPVRKQKRPDCQIIDRTRDDQYSWMPETCAYRLRHYGLDLLPWHPLLTGNREAMVKAGACVDHSYQTEKGIDEEDYPIYVRPPKQG